MTSTGLSHKKGMNDKASKVVNPSVGLSPEGYLPTTLAGKNRKCRKKKECNSVDKIFTNNVL